MSEALRVQILLWILNEGGIPDSKIDAEYIAVALLPDGFVVQVREHARLDHVYQRFHLHLTPMYTEVRRGEAAVVHLAEHSFYSMAEARCPRCR